MNHEQFSEFRNGVQNNCHITDARHGSDYGLCTYLLRMREYYRWEKGYGFSDPLDKDALSQWLDDREQLWEGLVEDDFQSLAVETERFDPFDADGINRVLMPHGLIYSGGYGSSGKPHFFLAELDHHEKLDGFSVFISGKELARDLVAPPAMSVGKTMFIRRESLRRMLWEKLESWRWSRPDNALGRAFSCYDFEQDTDATLDEMAEHEIELVILHEKGECEAAGILGEGWQEMLVDLAYTPAELIARAVRDHLADCLSTLPALSSLDRPSSFHFYIGNLGGMRNEIFPGLNDAYQKWHEEGDYSPLMHLAETGRRHWEDIAQRILSLHAQLGTEAAAPIAELGKECRI